MRTNKDTFKPVGGHDAMVEKWMKEPSFKKEYEQLDMEMIMLDIFLKARENSGMTQDEVAHRMGVKRSAVARLESNARHSPNLKTLFKYANAMDCNLNIEIIPRKPPVVKSR